MHMADALISPAVGGVMWAGALAVLGRSSAILQRRTDDQRPALMGVLAAFVFAAQMINFTIPGTGSSGHLGGGLLLAAVLGPAAAFVAITSILAIQAFFFADGGLLALGCNSINLGLFPCFVAFPLVFRKIAGKDPSRRRLTAAAIMAAIVGLQLGALAVVVETTLSGISSLPFLSFVLFMQPVHLAIGIVEGIATAAVLAFIREARPEMILAVQAKAVTPRAAGPVYAVILACAVVLGAVVSWFASSRPDGLEWAVARVVGGELAAPPDFIHGLAARIQDAVALMPDYAFRAGAGPAAGRAGTSVAGILGGVCSMAVVFALAMLFRRKTKGAAAL